MTNAALLNFYFIQHSYLFFAKKFSFSNIYISVNTIFECLYMFFGWERGHQLSTYATAGGWRVIYNVYSYVQGEKVSRLVCTYALTLFLSMFLATFLSYSVCFICRKSTLPLFKKNVFVTNSYLSLTRSISFVILKH